MCSTIHPAFRIAGPFRLSRLVTDLPFFGQSRGGRHPSRSGVALTSSSAEAGGAVWLDLGDTAETVVKIDSTGWTVVREGVPVLFRRTALTGVMPEQRQDRMRRTGVDDRGHHPRHESGSRGGFRSGTAEGSTTATIRREAVDFPVPCCPAWQACGPRPPRREELTSISASFRAVASCCRAAASSRSASNCRAACL